MSIAQLFLIHFAATLLMTGLIWFVQIVHYPLMALVGSAEISEYSRRHRISTTWVVAGPMLVEAGTAVWLPYRLPELVGSRLYIASLILLAVIWLSTAILQVPLHEKIGRNAGEHALRKLVLTNWIRTAAWTGRCILLALMLVHALDGQALVEG